MSPYTAVMEWVAADRLGRAEAHGALLFSVAVPSVVEPSLNVMTVPEGVPPADELTVAVNVTGCPNVDGLADDVRPVVCVEASLTTCETVGDVLPSKFPLLQYMAVMEWEVTERASDVLMVATPLPSSVPAPSVDEPSLNVTVPDGVPVAEVIVAVKVTV